MKNTDKKEIINYVMNANFKKLIQKLSKIGGFSKEKGVLKEVKNNKEFMKTNKLLYPPGTNSYDLAESSFISILKKLN